MYVKGIARVKLWVAVGVGEFYKKIKKDLGSKTLCCEFAGV